MSRRFSRIKQAPRLQKAYTSYKEYLDTVKTYTPRAAGSKPGGYVELAVTPFGMADTDKIIVKASKRANTHMGGTIGGRASTTLTGAVVDGGFVPAKIILFAGTGTESSRISDITKLEYQKRGGVSYTHPFGASTATERQLEAFNTLAAAFRANSANNAVSYQPERYQFNA